MERFEGKSEYLLYNALPTCLVKKVLAYNMIAKKEGFNVLMLASLKKYKGLEEFIDIAKLLEPYIEISFTLVINATKKDVTSYFDGKDLAHNIKILSSQGDVIPFYKKASLVLNLSHTDGWIETFGLTILEQALEFLLLYHLLVGQPK